MRPGGIDPTPLLRTPRLVRLFAAVQARNEADAIDLSHDLDHVLRVTRWCLRLAPEAGVDEELAVAAGLVHDLVNVPKESAQRPLGSELSAVAGKELLRDAGFGEDTVVAVVEAVRTCSWSRGQAPTSALGELLQDADRLDAIGAVGVARNFACAQAMASRSGSGHLHHPEDPGGNGPRDLDDVTWAADHYRRKLLKLAAGMHTPSARAEAARRHAFLQAFLDELDRECRPEPGRL